VWLTIGYKIEARSIPQTPTYSETTHFLDAIQVQYEERHNKRALRSLKNITSGSLEKCMQERDRRANQPRFRDITEKVLRKWPAFDENAFYILTHPLRRDDSQPPAYWIGFNRMGSLDDLRADRCGFDLNIEQDVCYLLTIRISDQLRHKGLGSDLYERVIEIAKELGCKVVIQTPAGYTDRGEARSDYLARRGWRPVGVVSVEMYYDIEPGYGARHLEVGN